MKKHHGYAIIARWCGCHGTSAGQWNEPVAECRER